MHEREIELKTLAKKMVFLEESYNDEKIREWEQEELKEEMNKIRQILFEKRYSPDHFVQYMQEYKTLTIEEYYKWIGK